MEEPGGLQFMGPQKSDTTEHTWTSVRSSRNKLYLKLASEMGRSGLVE